MRIKYKALALLTIVSLVVVGTSTLVITAARPLRTFADPLPSCGAGSTLVPPKGNTPAYCSCPSGQVLITGNPNTCSASCPNGTVQNTGSNGQVACNQPAATACSDGSAAPGGNVNNCLQGANRCGKGANAVKTSINIGCQGKGNPILDMTFGIIRFLSAGVGLVIVASMVYAGIQYASSRGDPNATAQAIKRIQSNVIALLIFIFGYAILNYVLPAGFLK